MNDWIEWNGVGSPDLHEKKIDILFKDGTELHNTCANLWSWKKNCNPGLEIVAYRVVKEADAATQNTTTDVTQILTDRGALYGKFTGHADVTQRLKVAIRSHLKKRQKVLADDQQEALEMICHKIGRIVNGDPHHADSWIDIAGYAKLVADRLQGVER